jgi:hypothetical protein
VFSNVVGLRFDRANDASWLARVDASDNQHHVKVAGPHGFTIQQLLIENAKGVALTSDASGQSACINSVTKPWGGGEHTHAQLVNAAPTGCCSCHVFALTNNG